MRAVSLVLLLSLATTAGAIQSSDFLSRTVATDGGNAFALPYRIYVPSACATSRKCPLFVFLHGAGETGTNNTAQLGNRANGAFALAEMAAADGDPAILAAPQAPEWWANEGPTAGVADMIDDIQREFGFDPARLYVSGLSMGGGGTVGFLQRYDAIAAAAVPICPAGEFSGQFDRDRFAAMPLWFFHAANDPTVAPSSSRNSVALLRGGDGDPTYTEYATGGHGIWTQSYNNPRVTDWLLAQRWRTRPLAIDPRMTLTSPSDEATFYTSASTIALAGTTAGVDANVSAVAYTFGATNGTATGTSSFTAGTVSVPAGARTRLRAIATGNAYVTGLGGATTFSRSVAVVNPAPANAPPSVALWIEPVVRVGTPVRIRGMVADDGLPNAEPTVAITRIEGPAVTLAIDPASDALAWFTPTVPGIYTFGLSANDGALTRTATGSVLVLDAAEARPTVRAINAGGPAYTSVDGVAFAAESGFTGGGTEALTTGVTTIAGTEDDTLHRTMRRGAASYSAAIANGRYLVVVYLSEWRWFTAFARGMNLTIENQAKLENFDLYRFAGLRNAMRMGFVVDVTDGTLNLAIARAAGATTDPRLDAFEVLALPPGDAVFKNSYE